MRGAIVLLAALAVVASSSARPAQIQRVTVIGDSVASAISVDQTATILVKQGIDADLELAPCRRLEGVGCPEADGTRPPSAVQLIQSLGSQLGPAVVVSVGYNDFEDQYAGNIADALAALKAAGVKHVFWLTLRAAHHPYITMNADIEAAAQQHPELTVLDWNVYSRSHPDWFQPDGLHLKNVGAIQMAQFIHRGLVAGGVALAPPRVVTTRLPLAHHGKTYSAKLTATAGAGHYIWSLLERAPAGIHLRATGAVFGTPEAKPGRYTFDVQVRDAAGSLATRSLTLRIAS
jgi:sirohydrochlorin ferrochelatase